MSELMICPKRKECKVVDCCGRKPHKKDWICDKKVRSCPKCVPYHQKPKSMFAGLRKGDRVEIITLSGATFLEYYHHFNRKAKVYYTKRYQNENEAPTERPICLLKSIKKLTVKR